MQSHTGAPDDGYESGDMGYTSPELSPSFLPANIIPSVDEEDARTAAMPTHERADLGTPPSLPASSMQATVFGVQRISPAPASPPRPSPTPPPVAQHLAPAVRTAPPAPPQRSAPPNPPSGLSAAAAALADQPTGFLRLPDALAGGHTPVGNRAAPPPAAANPSWLADQPTSWVALQPGPSDTPAKTPASAGGTAIRRRESSSPALAPQAAPSSLRPWLLSLGIGLLGGLMALLLILSAMRYFGSGKNSTAPERLRASDSQSPSRGHDPADRALAPGALPVLALDEAMRAVQRGDLDRAISVLKQARDRETGSTVAIDSLIDSLRRLRSNRLP